MTLSELSQEIGKAQVVYEEKANELISAQEIKQNAEIDLIRADSHYKKLRLELSVARSKIDSLKECSYNLRKEASI